MAVAMGGRIAEELIFGAENVTTGASGDFQQVSQHGAHDGGADGLLREDRPDRAQDWRRASPSSGTTPAAPRTTRRRPRTSWTTR